ncbi:MAG TPA: phosphomannomutase, partial [Paracoccus sp. (in: a-proteobacteria)]|nr:phosphomannomutase [Paracoccus sp. (in: a-proteobacteria)]
HPYLTRAAFDLIGARMAAFPSSGEINFRLTDPDAAIARVLAALEGEAIVRDDTDGISLEYPDWRFNLRRSNTEPVVRLNVESRGDAGLVAAQVARISELLTA